MEGLWIIIVIIALVFRVLNKAGEMKDRLPEVFGEKRIPPVIKDWGFPWDEENEEDKDYGWGEYTKSPETGVQSPQNTAKNTIMGTPMETTMGATLETQTNLQQVKEAPGTDKHPLIDSTSLINGLILSELLQPPKSKRLGRRF